MMTKFDDIIRYFCHPIYTSLNTSLDDFNQTNKEFNKNHNFHEEISSTVLSITLNANEYHSSTCNEFPALVILHSIIIAC